MTTATDGYLQKSHVTNRKIPKHDDIKTDWENIKQL